MEIRNLSQLRDLSSLSRAVFQADVPEDVIRSLPAQTLYHIVRHNGLESSLELIEAAGQEQIRLMLDFDLWTPDGLDEDNLWNWLELSSEEDDLSIMQKIVGSLDLKLVVLLINRYLEIRQNEEPTDVSPGPLFFTPDRGLTWIRVLCDDQRKHFLLSKLLAFLFESNSDIFYQLLGSKTVITPSVVEEEALADRNKRLAAEGMPDPQFAAEVTAFLSVADALEAVAAPLSAAKGQEVVIIETLARMSDGIEPLTSAIGNLPNIEECLSEMTLLINAAIVRFRIRVSDNDALAFVALQVQGALNLGLDLLSRRSSLSASEIVAKNGLQIPFRLGLTQILECGKLARKYEKQLLSMGEIDAGTQALLELLKRGLPCIPAALSEYKTDYAMGDIESLNSKPEPIRFLSELEKLKTSLTG